MKEQLNLLFWKYLDTQDERIFSQLFDHFYPRLYQFSIRFVRQHALAEEVVSDVFYKLLKQNQRLRNIKDISFYLFKAVKNQSISALRNPKKQLHLEAIVNEEDYLISSPYNPDNQIQDNEMQQIMNEVVKKLPAQRQMVFRLTRDEGLGFEEVADLLDISPRTVETHLGLAVKDLCASLKEYIQNQRHHSKIRKIFPR